MHNLNDTLRECTFVIVACMHVCSYLRVIFSRILFLHCFFFCTAEKYESLHAPLLRLSFLLGDKS